MTDMEFSGLGAHPALVQAIAARGYDKATPVQAAVLAEELKGRDLLVSSETGSGKTVAFGLAMSDLVVGQAEFAPRATKPLALVVAPTRELAQQVERELAWLYAGTGARVASCVGGADISREMRALSGGAHIVAGTPGRLCDHLDRKSLDLSQLRVVVLDEADEMLDMGFREELERILSAAPKERRTLLFSATIPAGIAALARNFQKDPARVSATPPKQAHRDIEYRAHLIARRERDNAVVNILRQTEASSAIVFCQTREGVNHLHANLSERGFLAVALSGELTQAERNRGLKALRDGRARVLVATDVAARGLDLPDVGLVIHADLPTNSETLQHRSGRTGRAGRKGVSVLLVPADKRRGIDSLTKGAHVSPTWLPVPTMEEIRKLDEARLIKDIEAAAPTETSEDDLAVARRLLETRSAEQLAAMLVADHRSRRPMPEDLPLTADLSARRDDKAKRPAPDRSAPRPQREWAPPAERHPAARTVAPRPVAAAPAAAPVASDEPVVERAFPARARTERPERAERPERKPAEGSGNTSWFWLNVGRDNGADPKWLIPALCTRGNITKADIGAIKIGADSTFVEITQAAATRFSVSVKKPAKQDKTLRIVPADPPASAARGPSASGKKPYRPATRKPREE